MASLGDDYERLNIIWKLIKESASSRLNTVSTYFPHFSLHNASHSNTICIQIERLLGENRIEKLSASDTFMLLSVFYLHDIGMALSYEDIYNKFNSHKFQKELKELVKSSDIEVSAAAKRINNFNTVNRSESVIEYKNSLEVYNDILLIIETTFRGGHAEKSFDIVKNDFYFSPDLGIRFVNLIAEICRLHQTDIEDILNLPQKSNGIVDDFIHPRFIASMLCLGDLLDLDTDRFNDNTLKSATPLPMSSKLHLLKHKSIKQFLVEPLGIEIISDCESLDVYRTMRSWTNWIKDTCVFLSVNWSSISPNNFNNAPQLAQCDILINGSTKWLTYANLGFNLTNKMAFELFQGANIYRNKFVCIREIIQNSIDATLLRLWADISEIYAVNSTEIKTVLLNENISKYKISVNIGMDADCNVIVTIRDYGIGISKDEISTIASIGNTSSMRKNKIIEAMPDWLRPSGAFGMGLQSIFQLTDQFEIITKTDSEPAKKIVFESVSDRDGNIIIEDYNKTFSRGTQLSFTISNSKITLDDLNCSEYHYKTGKKGILILNRINSLYNNKYKDAPPIIYIERQLYDYIPVEICLLNPYMDEMQKILAYDSMIEKLKDVPKYNVTNNTIEIVDSDNMNTYICDVKSSFHENESHIYGSNESLHYRGFGNVLFYKNVLVTSRIIEPSYSKNIAIFSQIDFSLNLLTKRANDILSLSRNSIKECFENHFIDICKSAIKHCICDLVDYMLCEKRILKDSAIILYQFSLFYNYRTDEFINTYYDELSLLRFNNYYSLDNEEEQTYDFQQLKNNHLYFAYSKVDESVFTNTNIIVEDMSDIANYCIELKPTVKEGKPHVLYHKAKRLFLGKIGELYYKFIEATPFYSNNTDLECEKDNYTILDDVVCAIYFELRCINIFSSYMELSTPLSSSASIHSFNHKKSMIELPFEETHTYKLKQNLINCGYFAEDVESFISEVLKSNKYAMNVEYISNYQNKKEEIIKEKYSDFIRKIVLLLSDENKAEYIKTILKWCENHGNFHSGFYEYIEHNHYMYFDI